MKPAVQIRIKGRPAPVARHRIRRDGDGKRCVTCGRELRIVAFHANTLAGIMSDSGLVIFTRHVGPKT